MGISKLLSCLTPGVESQQAATRLKLAGLSEGESARRVTVDTSPKNIYDEKHGISAVDGCGDDGINNQDVALPPLPCGKKLSKRKLAKLRKAEEEAERLAKEEEEETMSQYLGKSASCTSLNSLPAVLSSSSLSRCVTPERRAKDIMVQFDGQGKVVVRNRQSSIGSEASWPISTPSSLMATPDCSDLRGLGVEDRLEMSDLTSVSHSVSATEFSVSIDTEGLETMEYIPKAIRSVSNPRFGEVISESVFKNFGQTVVVGGSWQRGTVGQAAETDVIRCMSAQDQQLKRNISWSHMSEISLGIRRSSSEAMLNRRHTVLVLTNDVEDDCLSSDEEDNGTKIVSDGELNASPAKQTKMREQLPRKVSQVFESHHVHLCKLQEQMGDASRAPEDLLQLMSRKIFESRSDISSSNSDMDGAQDIALLSSSQTQSSHDLSECSDRLPRIRTSR